MGDVEYLAWTGFRSDLLQDAAGLGPGPSIFWSVKDPTGYRRWMRRDELSPGAAELTLELPNVDTWIVRQHSGATEHLTPSTVVERINQGIEQALDE